MSIQRGAPASTDAAPIRLSLLMSFAGLAAPRNIDRLILPLAEKIDVMIDSGGFTLRTAEITGNPAPRHINIPDYIEACRRFDGNVWGYVQLDRPMSPKTCTEMLDAQLDAGVRPIPVWTANAPESDVQRLLDVAPDGRICVAGGARGSTQKHSHARFQRIHVLTDGRVKTHALGFGRYPQVFQLPITTVDTSSYSQGQRFGLLMVFHPRFGMGGLGHLKLRRMHVEASAYGPLQTERHAATTRALCFRSLARAGITDAEIKDDDLWKGAFSIPSMMATLAYIDMAHYFSLRGVQYFVSASSIESLISFAVWIRRASDGRRMLWREAAEECSQMQALSRSNFSLFMDEFTDAIGRQIIPTYDNGKGGSSHGRVEGD